MLVALAVRAIPLPLRRAKEITADHLLALQAALHITALAVVVALLRLVLPAPGLLAATAVQEQHLLSLVAL